jgi:hypothetical protein
VQPDPGLTTPALAEVAGMLGLGPLAGEPRPLKRGMSPTWRILTDSGDFHVKVWRRREWAWHDQFLDGVAEVETAAVRAGESGRRGIEAFAGTLGMALGRIAYAMFQSATEWATQTAHISPAVAKLGARLAGLAKMGKELSG